jgi:hypothetical protein
LTNNLNLFIHSLVILLCCSIAIKFQSITALVVECVYKSENEWQANEYTYNCDVQNQDMFKGSNVTIERSLGTHDRLKTNDDVQGFKLMSASKLTKFPANLERVFKNLILIYIRNSELSEITSDDMQSFFSLKFLYLYSNRKLNILRSGTFDNNPHLEVVDLEGSQIMHIDATVFSSLYELRALDLSDTSCDTLGRQSNREQVRTILQRIGNGECHSNDLSITTTTTEGPNPMKVKMEQQQKEIYDLTAEHSAVSKRKDDLDAKNRKMLSDILSQEKENKMMETQEAELSKKLEQKKDEIETCLAKVQKAEKTAVVNAYTALDMGELRAKLKYCDLLKGMFPSGV